MGGRSTSWSSRDSMLRGFMTSVLNCGCRKVSRTRLCSSSRTCTRASVGYAVLGVRITTSTQGATTGVHSSVLGCHRTLDS